MELAYSIKRVEGLEKDRSHLLRAQAIHPKVAMIAFKLACYASVTGRIEEAKVRLRHAIEPLSWLSPTMESRSMPKHIILPHAQEHGQRRHVEVVFEKGF